MIAIQPIILTGEAVRLEPLGLQHLDDLIQAGSAADIWKYMPYGDMGAPGKMREFIAELLKKQAAGTDLPFCVIYRQTGKAIGMTRFLDIQPANRGLEIGGTWYVTEFQRTRVNSECKFLLLQHAFEVLGCNRVQFKTDVRNERSRRAIERIGAQFEGILREHIIMPDGTIRSSAYYSILASEWPGVKAKLSERLKQS
jgi:RimJ/RimL family protein N-acetyltransferase